MSKKNLFLLCWAFVSSVYSYADDWQLIAKVGHPGPVQHVAFDRDGHVITAAGGNRR